MTRPAPDPFNIVIAGVGGQGNLLASQIIATAAVSEGYYVTVGETYGITQRGGSVMSHIRLSRRFQLGPLVSAGEAHLFLGFEPLETLRRFYEYGNSESIVVLNPRPQYPVGVLRGDATYPSISELVETMRGLAARVKVVEGSQLALHLGVPTAQNVVMVGALSALEEFPLPRAALESALAQSFEGDRLSLNLAALNEGAGAVLGG